jgi:type III secretion protein Q
MIDQFPQNLAQRPGPIHRSTDALKPLFIHRMMADELRYWKQIGIRRVPICFDWLDRQWLVTIGSASEPASVRMAEILADWGNASIRIRLDISLLRTAVGALTESTADIELPAEIHAILVEAVLDKVFTLIEKSTRKRFSLLSIQMIASQENVLGKYLDRYPHGITFQLDDGHYKYQAEAWVDILGLGFIANSLRILPPQPQPWDVWSALPFHLMLTVGWTTLAMEDLRSLAKFDVVLLDECLINDSFDSIVVMLGPKRAIEARIEGTRLHLIEEKEGILDDFDEDEADNPELLEQTTDLDKLPVRLQFDLGERVIPFSEVQTLGPGYVLELGREIRRAVTIRANGYVIGEGELVDIDGRIGVSIQKIIPPAP